MPAAKASNRLLHREGRVVKVQGRHTTSGAAAERISGLISQMPPRLRSGFSRLLESWSPAFPLSCCGGVSYGRCVQSDRSRNVHLSGAASRQASVSRIDLEVSGQDAPRDKLGHRAHGWLLAASLRRRAERAGGGTAQCGTHTHMFHATSHEPSRRQTRPSSQHLEEEINNVPNNVPLSAEPHFLRKKDHRQTIKGALLACRKKARSNLVVCPSSSVAWEAPVVIVLDRLGSVLDVAASCCPRFHRACFGPWHRLIYIAGGAPFGLRILVAVTGTSDSVGVSKASRQADGGSERRHSREERSLIGGPPDIFFCPHSSCGPLSFLL